MLPFLELDPTIVKDMITVNITAATYLCHQVINCNHNDDLDYVVFSFYLRWYQRGRVLSSTLPPSVPLLQLIIECACTWDIALKEVLPELHFSQVATCPDRTLQSMLLPSTTCTLSPRCHQIFDKCCLRPIDMVKLSFHLQPTRFYQCFLSTVPGPGGGGDGGGDPGDGPWCGQHRDDQGDPGGAGNRYWWQWIQ